MEHISNSCDPSLSGLVHLHDCIDLHDCCPGSEQMLGDNDAARKKYKLFALLSQLWCGTVTRRLLMGNHIQHAALV